ncbi:hypothetical protein [Brachybacterium alimentarium]|uniref:hypothetical protein n=1 Tax=Brachybacterium alimentarium TaxID=47845 RepID=UPI000DF3FE0A|nr:hypothetical protein [Brachybacterium alimentarium]RCS81327.1 hypothetical protein CIK67_16265 [Brachybacterium alimentarium]
MIAEHFAAVKALVESADLNVKKVYDTDAGNEPVFPYIVLWGGDFERYSVDVAGSRVEVVGDIGVTCVSSVAGAARQLQSKVAELLDGALVTVPGRHGFELSESEVRPVQVDREVQIPTVGGGARYPYFGVLTYRVETTEGSA